jgi:hypothetical protein
MSRSVWLLRVAWLTLPLTAGAAANDAIRDFADAPRVVAAVLLFASWGAGAVAVLVPHPVGLTLLRTVAPASAVFAVAARVSGETSGLEGWGAIAVTLIAAGLTSHPGVGRAAGNGIAYGDEDRFPLRVPPALYLGPIPIARALVVAAVVTGPLLLADEEIGLGLVALALGVPIVVVGARALHGLSRRWLVVVPAGVVVLDPMTLAEPMLFVRRQVRALQRVAGTTPVDGSLDLRLGATLGTVRIDLNEETSLTRRNGRKQSTIVSTHALLIAVVAPDQLLASAARRVPVTRSGVAD